MKETKGKAQIPDEIYVMVRLAALEDDEDEDDEAGSDDVGSRQIYDNGQLIVFTNRELAIQHSLGRKAAREIGVFRLQGIAVPKVELLDVNGNPLPFPDEETKMKEVRRKIRKVPKIYE